MFMAKSEFSYKKKQIFNADEQSKVKNHYVTLLRTKESDQAATTSEIREKAQSEKERESINEDAEITVEFAAPERLDELTRIQVDQARVSLYSSLSMISDPELMMKTGLLTKEEINGIMKGREARAAAALEDPEGQF